MPFKLGVAFSLVLGYNLRLLINDCESFFFVILIFNPFERIINSLCLLVWLRVLLLRKNASNPYKTAHSKSFMWCCFTVWKWNGREKVCEIQFFWKLRRFSRKFVLRVAQFLTAISNFNLTTVDVRHCGPNLYFSTSIFMPMTTIHLNFVVLTIRPLLNVIGSSGKKFISAELPFLR